jgi:hypothetical protein
VSFAVTAATQAMTYANGATDQARMAILNFTGTAGAASVFAPPSSKTYVIKNATNGIVTVYNSTVLGNTTAAGAGVAIPIGATRSVWSDGTNVYTADSFVDLATSATSATTATNATNATNLTGTTQWSTPYQSASGVTSYLASGTSGYFKVSGGSGAPSWSNALPTSATIDGVAVGYRSIPQNMQGTNYTLVASDAGKHIYATASALTFTIPANASVAYPIGTAISFVNFISGTATIAITSDAMYLAGTGATGSRSLALYGVATALKITATAWVISGTGLT